MNPIPIVVELCDAVSASAGSNSNPVPRAHVCLSTCAILSRMDIFQFLVSIAILERVLELRHRMADQTHCFAGEIQPYIFTLGCPSLLRDCYNDSEIWHMPSREATGAGIQRERVLTLGLLRPHAMPVGTTNGKSWRPSFRKYCYFSR